MRVSAVIACGVAMIIAFIVWGNPVTTLGTYDVPTGKLTVYTDTTAIYEPAEIIMVTVKFPEMASDDAVLDETVNAYSNRLIGAGFTADLACECLTGPRDVAKRMSDSLFTFDGIAYERL